MKEKLERGQAVSEREESTHSLHQSPVQTMSSPRQEAGSLHDSGPSIRVVLEAVKDLQHEILEAVAFQKKEILEAMEFQKIEILEAVEGSRKQVFDFENVILGEVLEVNSSEE